MAVYPGDPEVVLDEHDRLPEAGYNTSRIAMGTHTGTHMDAPFHFLAGGNTVDEIVLKRCHGPAVVIDLAPGSTLAAGTALDMKAFARYAELFEPEARVLLRTGWDRRWGSASYYENYPSIELEAARWMTERGVWLVGMDTPGPGSKEVHSVLLEAGAVIVEGLCALDRLPSEFIFSALPLKLKGLDGSPVRAVGIVECGGDSR